MGLFEQTTICFIKPAGVGDEKNIGAALKKTGLSCDSWIEKDCASRDMVGEFVRELFPHASKQDFRKMCEEFFGKKIVAYLVRGDAAITRVATATAAWGDKVYCAADLNEARRMSRALFGV